MIVEHIVTQTAHSHARLSRTFVLSKHPIVEQPIGRRIKEKLYDSTATGDT